MKELEALQNAAKDLGLVIHQKPYYKDKRRSAGKYFAQQEAATVSPMLDYENMNHFLLGWRNALKHVLPK